MYHEQLLRNGVENYALRECIEDYLSGFARCFDLLLVSAPWLTDSRDNRRTFVKTVLSRLIAFCEDHDIASRL
jgi:hypothetical protein